MQLQQFRKLSVVLTGFENLEEKIIKKYFFKIKAEYSKEFDILMLQFEENLKISVSEQEAVSKLVAHDEILFELIKTIILLWYSGEFHKRDKTITLEAEDYYNALLWKTIHAHPPGLSGGYFGYWKYKPEN